jgi:hypothetical protein
MKQKREATKQKGKGSVSNILGLASFRGFYTRSPYSPEETYNRRKLTDDERKKQFIEKVVFHAFEREWKQRTFEKVRRYKGWPGEYLTIQKKSVGADWEEHAWGLGYEQGCSETKDVFRSLIQCGAIQVNEKAIGREIEAASRIEAHDLPAPEWMPKKLREDWARETTAASIRWDAEQWAHIFPDRRKLATRQRALQDYLFHLLREKDTRWQSWRAWAKEVGCGTWEIKSAMKSLKAAHKISWFREVSKADATEKVVTYEFP